ncbi:MAG TPA: DUF305 domain-containing protein [Thermoanaerobaculia bacterium]|nr:DUF305 domain-containing protein [Thermoanaerobaculia bacterium]
MSRRRALAVLILTLVPLACRNDEVPEEARQFETRFLQRMVSHHAMAVQTGRLCDKKAEHEELRQLCQGIVTGQTREIDQMLSWLRDWYGVTPGPTVMSPAEHQQMMRLDQAAGAAFETEFLKHMIDHHHSAVVESRDCPGQAAHAEVDQLCESVAESQQREIEQMQGWLCSWHWVCGYTPQGGGHSGH